MSPKCGISESQRRGSVGEPQIEARLSDFAQVLRPKELHDVGLDFFCRLLDGEKITNRTFWVQAKTTKLVDKSWRLAIKRDTVEFWLKQASPVFIMVYDVTHDSCYWISVEANRELWAKKINTKQKTLALSINFANVLNRSREQNALFLAQVDKDIIHVNKVYGIPMFIGGYVGSIPVMKLTDNERIRFAQTVRLGLNYLIYDCWLVKDIKEAHRLCKILAEFDLSHYDNFLMLARLSVQLDMCDEAKRYYELAIAICRRDDKWNKLKAPNDPTIEEIVETIEREKLEEIEKLDCTYRSP